MNLSVVVPTLNGRRRLEGTLDALRSLGSDVEVVVVNGPSTDGTTGLVRAHPAADRLIEVAERNANVARNAGIAAASGGIVAFLGEGCAPEDGWHDRLISAFEAGADVVTGPVHRSIAGGVTTQTRETETLAGRTITYFDASHVAFRASVLDALDGFDEYLETGGDRDVAHRLPGLGREVTWDRDLAVLCDEREQSVAPVATDGGSTRGRAARSLAYRLTKNYGFSPGAAIEVTRRSTVDAVREVRAVVTGDEVPSRWAGDGREAATSLLKGARDGFRARLADRTPRRNPNGVSSRMDRAVASYEF